MFPKGFLIARFDIQSSCFGLITNILPRPMMTFVPFLLLSLGKLGTMMEQGHVLPPVDGASNLRRADKVFSPAEGRSFADVVATDPTGVVVWVCSRGGFRC